MKVCIVSSCLLGLACRYDGKAFVDLSENLKSKYLIVPVCPEQLSGLPTPREKCEIVGGDGFDVLSNRAKVMTESGRDVTDVFIKGAKMTLKICKITNAKIAFLKDFSPSCGVKSIYNGSFSGKKVRGVGVTTALLTKNKIKVEKII